MRKMLIVRGPQASGKTHLVRALELEGHRLSADVMREAHRGRVLNHKGQLVIDQENAHQIWGVVQSSLEYRISRSEFIAMDATFANPELYEAIIDRAAAAGYEIAIVDFYGMNEDTLFARNALRDAHERVPEKSMRRMLASYQPHPKDDARISAHFTHCHSMDEVQKWIRAEVVNLDEYERIVHIGDLQGVFSAAFCKSSPLDYQLRDDTFYIFVGDALDRGLENGAVLDWIIEQVNPRLGKNVVWIEGNHERHLADFIEGRDIVSREFENRTLYDLVKTNPQNADIRAFLAGMSEYFLYTHMGQLVIVTHAGLPAVPDNLTLVPGYQAMHGAGGFGADVDADFAEWAATQGRQWRQVHGHRNRKMHPPRVNEYSFNLEGQAEFGGHVRFAVKTRYGWETMEARNTIFRSPREWRDIDAEENRKPFSRKMPIPAWQDRYAKDGFLSAEALAAYDAHEHVNIRTQESRPHIDTIAFGKSAFYGQHWDGITNKARGLFIDNRSRRIVARSFEKFFNLGERPETELDFICANWSFPMAMSLKENGYLGLASWDHSLGELVFSSKGSMDNDFAALFEQIATRVLGPGGIERLARAVRDLNGTATFEVISPTEDPHIVEYDEERLVLLDFVHNAEEFEKLDYKRLVQLAKYIEVEHRDIIATLPNEQALRAQVAKLRDPSSALYKREIEGVVIEDADGRHVKVKSGWYDHWKHARRLVERLALQRRRDEEINLRTPAELEDFMAWVEKQADEITDLPIIELRRRFLETPDELLVVDREALEAEKRAARIASSQEKEITGFMQGYDALLGQVRAGTASADSVDRLLKRGLAEPHLRKALEARSDYHEMVGYEAR
ncbi:RNA ligase [Erythrobacter aureus]|nr:RNA ligase [Erythrobacter aureus]